MDGLTHLSLFSGIGGLDFVGCETEREYYRLQEDAYDEYVSQIRMGEY